MFPWSKPTMMLMRWLGMRQQRRCLSIRRASSGFHQPYPQPHQHWPQAGGGVDYRGVATSWDQFRCCKESRAWSTIFREKLQNGSSSRSLWPQMALPADCVVVDLFLAVGSRCFTRHGFGPCLKQPPLAQWWYAVGGDFLQLDPDLLQQNWWLWGGILERRRIGGGLTAACGLPSDFSIRRWR